MASVTDPAAPGLSSLTRLLAAPRYEVIPVRDIEARAGILPAGSSVTVTASPGQGMAATIDVAAALARSGYAVVPHLAARMLNGRSELEDMIERLAAAGVYEAFVVGGDASPPAGPYRDAGDLLDELAGLSHPFIRIGVAGYPEGHPLIADDGLLETLRRKQPQASYIVTQLCFDAAALTTWLRAIRQEGIGLPVVVGLPGVVERRKLAEISLRSGVGASLRYLRKNGRHLAALARSRRYDPTPLAAAVADRLDRERLVVEGVHLFTFNQIERTLDWVRRLADG